MLDKAPACVILGITFRGPANSLAKNTDALSALVNLGYRHRDVKNAIDQVSRTSPPPTSLDELIREGLKILSKP